MTVSEGVVKRQRIAQEEVVESAVMKTSVVIEEVPTCEGSTEVTRTTLVDFSVELKRGMMSPLVELLHVTSSWRQILQSQFSELYFHDLTRFLIKELNGKVFPEVPNIFNALNKCAFEKVKVVILGQDPYHDDGQAMGLSFSVPEGFKIPSSLLNIYKELESDLGIPRAKSGDLSAWTERGVLLLNAVLTVRAHAPNSHEGKGWERFTDFVVKAISDKLDNVVFVLWGKFAEKKGTRIDRKRHLVLTSPHPSGLSASRGFFGSKPFSKCNSYLEEHGRGPIDWDLNPKA